MEARVTCIVGLVEKGAVYIAGDSAGVVGLTLTVRADQKVFTNGEFVMGFTTSFRMGQLLRHAFTPPKRHPDVSVEKFMVTDFINAVRECLQSGGYAEKHNGAERGGVFLVGYSGRLFIVDSDYQVGEAADGFDAVGCGADIARGSLYSSSGDPLKRLGVALDAAERFSAGVRRPFHYTTLAARP
ncbi:MAG: hypothetical protein M9944_07950 [Rhizobiaceae bacterium]|nr:hypothetical protein [Rhizobiaceae bacterium]